MPSRVWTKAEAEYYDETSPEMFAPNTLDPCVDFLFDQARGGRVLEFAIGTGRVALPLAARGLDVCGVELSPGMAEQLARKPGADAIAVTIGDMATTRVDGEFSLVYLVWNAINNVPTQDEQVAVFENAAAHLAPGGRFVVEVGVPKLLHPFAAAREPEHVCIDTIDDVIGQLMSSHHWMNVNGRFVYSTGQYRYVWPSELVLMARIAGLRMVERWGGWRRTPFTADGATNSITVFEK